MEGLFWQWSMHCCIVSFEQKITVGRIASVTSYQNDNPSACIHTNRRTKCSVGNHIYRRVKMQILFTHRCAAMLLNDKLITAEQCFHTFTRGALFLLLMTDKTLHWFKEEKKTTVSTSYFYANVQVQVKLSKSTWHFEMLPFVFF